MAVNESRSMIAELNQGLLDGRYMQLAPNWSVDENPPTERMDWPTYRQVDRHQTENVRQVPTVDNQVVQVARHRQGVEMSPYPSRHTYVDRDIYRDW